jgi:predicted transcriptional regulator of viral defense system
VPSTKQPHRQRHRAPRHELAALPTVFSYAQAREAGLSQRRIYWLRDHGWIDPLARGTYRRVVADIEADPDLTEIAARAPEGTICLTSALARHDLTDAIPGSVDIALPRGRRRPSTAAPVTWHTFARETFEIGRGRLDLADEVSIGLYGAERSIIDAFRLRYQEGPDLAHEALRRWLRRRGSSPAALLDMAQAFPKALPGLRMALEILL